jgi:chitinase
LSSPRGARGALGRRCCIHAALINPTLNVAGLSGNDPIESQYLLELVKSVRAAIGPQMLLSVDIAPGEWLGGQYKVELQEFVDYVNLMAFDFTGAWPSSEVGHHADYTMFVKAIEHTLDRGFRKEKLLVGLPAYGIEFIDGKNSRIRHVGFNEIVTLATNNAQALKNGQIDNIYFETKEQFARKAKYVTGNDLAGVFVFDLASDVLDDKLSLMYSLKKYILIGQAGNDRQ